MKTYIFLTQDNTLKLANGHAEGTQRRNSVGAPVQENNQVNGTNNGECGEKQETKNDADNSTSTLKKKAGPPKLPPRSVSLNSLNKRPLPPTPNQVSRIYMVLA